MSYVHLDLFVWMRKKVMIHRRLEDDWIFLLRKEDTKSLEGIKSISDIFAFHISTLLVMKQKIQNSCYSKRQIAHLIKKYLLSSYVYFAN